MITKQKGTYDLYGVEAKKRQYINNVLRDVCSVYNYDYIETPIFEASELFHRTVGETSDLVSKETYDFVDRGDRKITLRPEGTAGVVRWFIENKLYGNLTEPVKVYYNAKMYRYERPQSGRNREFTQFGVECIGSNDVLSDAECISILYYTYRLLGIEDIKIKLNTLGDKESRDNYRNALIEYLKPHINNLCDDCKERYLKNPLRVLDCKVDSESPILKNAPKTIDYLNQESLDRYNKLKEYLDLMEIDYIEDYSLVRGLDYYDHTVFEGVVTIDNEASLALGGGGRYNGLVSTLDGPDTPAVGFAIGVDRTMLILDNLNIKLKIEEGIDVYVMYVSDTEKETAAYIVQNLRMNGFKTETDYLNKNLKAQFKSSDRFKAKYLVILSDEDLHNNEVTVKDNVTKEEEKVKINNLTDYLDMKV